ncbi:MAG TPA: AAA family ATPase [Streptosporangiaceae bacterium]|nr:AAA family ATPase [Streptosporangiaceae bacterium]
MQRCPGGADIRGQSSQELNSFVGREWELAELHRLIRETRALTLSGVGGIGKTRLALRLLDELADDYPDGVWFVELADLQQPDLVVSRVAATVGVGEEPGRPPLETLANALSSRTMLLVLDNCEHLLSACARVGCRLLGSAPGLRVLATSREPLRMPGEMVWQVPPLAVAPANYIAGGEDPYRYEAIQLFADRAAACSPGFTVAADNAAAVAALCRALDGMPLAIELAAARVRALSVAQIAGRLVNRFALLTNGERTSPPRQRTLRSAIDWSHDLLTTREQVLLRRLSVFAGWSLEMAEKVCSDQEIPAADMLDLTTALVDKSLVVVEPEALGQTRYRMLDTIREYAAARLAEAGESATFGRRFRDYTVAVAEHNHAVGMALTPAPWSARVDVFRRYDIEIGNVWQVLDQCLADGDVEEGLRICTAVRPCWLVRGTYTEGGERLDALLAYDTSGVSPVVLGAALVGRAQLAMSSDPSSAREMAERGLRLCQDVGDGFWTASALNLLSEITLHTQRTAQASWLAEEALSVARAVRDGWNEGYALGIQATIAALLGRLGEAQQLATASITVMRRIDQQWGIARALLGMGDLARLRGRPGEASGRYLEALEVLREIDARPEIARCLAGLGRVAMDLGEFGSARQHLAESIQLSHSTGARIGVARGLEAFAALAVQEERPEMAVRLAAAATALREAAGLPALSAARVERYLTLSRRLGESAIARLWAQGLSMNAESAIALALDAPAGDQNVARAAIPPAS